MVLNILSASSVVSFDHLRFVGGCCYHALTPYDVQRISPVANRRTDRLEEKAGRRRTSLPIDFVTCSCSCLRLLGGRN